MKNDAQQNNNDPDDLRLMQAFGVGLLVGAVAGGTVMLLLWQAVGNWRFYLG